MKLDSEEAQRLSKLLWECQEQCEMYAELIALRSSFGTTDASMSWPTRVARDVKAWRAEMGWSVSGFGNEAGVT